MLNRVTITGADDKTSIDELLDLSLEFPFVEWGILLSKRHEGTSRFPSRAWSDLFLAQAKLHHIHVAVHLCGAWVRELLMGNLQMSELPDIAAFADRIQINTHAEFHVSTVKMFDFMQAAADKTFIFQLDGINDHLFDAASTKRSDVAGLFDASHGAGVLPNSWPIPSVWARFYGYAGGLGPNNLAEQIPRIHQAALHGVTDYWIDMEGRVRNYAGEFDLGLVHRALDICAPFVGHK